MKRGLLYIIAILFSIIGLSSVAAFANPFYLTYSNSLPDGYLYATIDIAFTTDHNGNTDDDRAVFTVSANRNLLPPLVFGNYGIDKFYLNTNPELDEDDFILGSGWVIKQDRTASEFGAFEILYKGTGGVRSDPLEFTIMSTDIAIGNFVSNAAGYKFAAHIAGFTLEGSGVNSAFFADSPYPVPEPATSVLLGIGLLGAGLVVRKKTGRK